MGMQIKVDAPAFAGATSPQKRFLKRLEDISEAAPGPNAFAQQVARMERHRLDSNAFYQREVRERAAPRLGEHPALRGRSLSDPPTPPRKSMCTTMSPFIDAGVKEGDGRMELRLLPSGAELAEPTTRAIIEEETERIVHEVSGSEEERTPVFVASATFGGAGATPTKQAEKQKGVTIAELPHSHLPVKTPKRSILEKLRLNTSFRSSTNTPSTKAAEEEVVTESVEPMPVKAKAVLGSPTKRARVSMGSLGPAKTNITRSPSKRKGLFSRMTTGVPESTSTRSKSALSSRSTEPEQAPHTSSTFTKTPPTAFSDPTHYSYGYASNSSRLPSQTQADQSKDKRVKPAQSCSVVRSQSLKYFDYTIPPTPPTKDTPPEEKAKRDAELEQKSGRAPFQQGASTPSKTPSLGVVSTSERVSPTKFGKYGHHEMPTLVTQPSMYSLHASVVPNMTETSTFEEMKARINGLGLEGFSLPRENRSSPKRGTVYSPSIYTEEWNAGKRDTRFLYATPPPPVPPLQLKNHGKSNSDESKSSSGHGHIPIFFPGLIEDPSFRDANIRNADRARSPVQEHLDVTIPWHGRTHSRDHSSDSRYSKDSSIFAHHVDEDLDKSKACDQSPVSFSHPSATPSPLHFLPATTYQPPVRKTSRQENALLTPAQAAPTRDVHRSAVEHFGYNPPSSSSRPSNGLLENAPRLQARTASSLTGKTRHSPSPAIALRMTLASSCDIMDAVDVDPLKPSTPSPTLPQAPAEADKLDAMIEMLQTFKSRNNEISSIRDEMRASNARLGERLAAVENLRGRDSPTPSSAGSSGWSVAAGARTVGDSVGSEIGRRVDTATAYEFYRSGHGMQNATGNYGRDGRTTTRHHRSDTIAELRETNTKLLEMVSGFAQKIREMEGRYPGDHEV